MENIYFSGFTIKVNGVVYEVLKAPDIRRQVNYFQDFLQLAPGIKAFRRST